MNARPSKNALVVREWPLSASGAIVARRDEQQPAARAATRARQAEIDDPPPPPVVEHSAGLRKRLDDHRPRSQIDHAE
jgi:hypothetical protein